MSTWPPPPEEQPGQPPPGAGGWGGSPAEPPPPPGWQPSPPAWGPQPPPAWGGQPPAYGNPYESKPTASQLSIISLVSGIVGMFLSPCCGVFAVPVGIAAVVCGVLALIQLKTSPQQEGKGMAIAGIACGGAAVLLAVVFFIAPFGAFLFI